MTDSIKTLAEEYAKNHSQAPDKECPDWIIQDFTAGYEAAEKKGEERFQKALEFIENVNPVNRAQILIYMDNLKSESLKHNP